MPFFVLTLAVAISTANNAVRFATLPPEKRAIAVLAHDLKRFPSLSECGRWIARADQHLDWIDQQMLLQPAYRDRWQTYRQQVVDWRGVWQTLRIVQSPALLPEDVKRMAVIRAVIGEDNYQRGYVPPPIASYFLDSP